MRQREINGQREGEKEKERETDRERIDKIAGTHLSRAWQNIWLDAAAASDIYCRK